MVRRAAIVRARNRPQVVQVFNPKSGRYVKVVKSTGEIIHKKSPGAYVGIPVVGRLPGG